MYKIIDDENNLIAEGDNREELIKEAKLFNFLKTEYGVRLIKSHC